MQAGGLNLNLHGLHVLDLKSFTKRFQVCCLPILRKRMAEYMERVTGANTPLIVPRIRPESEKGLRVQFFSVHLRFFSLYIYTIHIKLLDKIHSSFSKFPCSKQFQVVEITHFISNEL